MFAKASRGLGDIELGARLGARGATFDDVDDAGGLLAGSEPISLGDRSRAAAWEPSASLRTSSATTAGLGRARQPAPPRSRRSTPQVGLLSERRWSRRSSRSGWSGQRGRGWRSRPRVEAWTPAMGLDASWAVRRRRGDPAGGVSGLGGVGADDALAGHLRRPPRACARPRRCRLALGARRTRRPRTRSRRRPRPSPADVVASAARPRRRCWRRPRELADQAGSCAGIPL